jgi:hypothetical protein
MPLRASVKQLFYWVVGQGMGSIRVNDSGFPLVIVSFEGTVDDTEFEAYLARMDSHVERRQRCAFVFDATHAGRSPATQRRSQAEWMKAHELRTPSPRAA